MTSTLSGMGKGSRGPIHLQVGSTVGVAACGSSGSRTVRTVSIVTCKRCKKITEGEEKKPSGKPHIYSKRYAGHSCPHGLKFYFVDGAEVRKKGYGDFVFGGNGFRYPSFCPRGELWLERTIDPKEVHFVAFHECQETSLMAQGQSYDRAHEAAKRLEDKARRNAGPLRQFIKSFFSFPPRQT